MWELIFLCLIMWFFGGLVIVQALSRKKWGGELWKVYNEVAHEMGLTEKEEAAMGYGLPDIIGKIRGLRVYIHPIVGKSSIPKTVFAVENKIRFKGTSMIANKHISRWVLGKFAYDLKIKRLIRHSSDYLISGTRRGDGPLLRKLFTDEVCEHFNGMAQRDIDDFVGLILEAGIVMFYTRGWEDKKAALKEKLMKVVGLVELLEKSAPELDSGIENKKFKLVSEKSDYKAIEMLLSAMVTFIGIIVLGVGVWGFSNTDNLVFTLNLGLLLILIGVSRIYATKTMQETISSNR